MNPQSDNVTMGRFPAFKPKDGGDPPTGDDDMQQRVRDLEKDVQSIKTDLAVMKSNYATKEDVSNAKNSIIMWVVGAVIFAQLIPAIPSILDAIKRMTGS
ncbi:hypothetical protein J1F62_20540 [Klebsiella michiganensis]|uniref:hypothetical protein n=1 Tax=Klebsiella TaxID=570 RepID=UPI001A927B63|nr:MULTISPECIES: hypothetical protein [Klebsiella]MCD6620961.1 hypothetical protein [Klebsiella michiganensis]QSW13235.1 hypothetical protein J1F62_20540 [Klebsiella michiganensis]